MKEKKLVAHLFACVTLGALGAACGTEPPKEHATPSAAPSASAGPANAVQHEMRLLLAAMHTAMEGIAYGDVSGLPQVLHQVHEAKAGTEAALEGGAYRLPKNPDGVARFRELDEAFHGHLVKMVQAGRKNDVAAAAQAYAAAASACGGCHGEFRK
ncbi:MAG: cytochrome c [Myxococcales bacterium]|nr:cytochrome c [Myxococcales bacterium]